LLPFPEARAYVKDEWRREQEKSAKERYVAELRKKYDVVVDATAGSLLAPVASVDAANPGPAKP
jgi:hypothetical protein